MNEKAANSDAFTHGGSVVGNTSAGSPTDLSKAPQSDELINRIKESADKLARDGSSRGDLKIVSRALRELRSAFKVFSPYRNQRKVSVFGSARTSQEDPRYQQAVELGRLMAKNDWLVLTGAASGIMEAGHQGAGRSHSMGLNIMLPFEQDANPVIAGDPKLVHMKYFFTRKLMFVKECDAVVCCPGGFGTLDEALEVLTLLQTGKREMVPVVFLDVPGKNYWKVFHDFIVDHLLTDGMISENDLSLFKLTDNAQEAVDEILQFFRVYHSMRFVKQQLVLRLQSAPSEQLLADINQNFSDILVDGEFISCAALPEEKDQPDLADMPRLAFHFDRRSHGRLREMIDCLNRGSIDETPPT